MIDEETRQITARELAAGVYSSLLEAIERSIVDGAQIYVGTIEGVPTTEVQVSRNRTRLPFYLRHYVHQVCFTCQPFFILFMH